LASKGFISLHTELIEECSSTRHGGSCGFICFRFPLLH